MQKFTMRDLSSVHKQAIDAMKDQVLIVLINRLGGQVELPVTEIDATDGLGLAMRLDTDKRSFYFEVMKADGK